MALVSNLKSHLLAVAPFLMQAQVASQLSSWGLDLLRTHARHAQVRKGKTAGTCCKLVTSM